MTFGISLMQLGSSLGISKELAVIDTIYDDKWIITYRDQMIALYYMAAVDNQPIYINIYVRSNAFYFRDDIHSKLHTDIRGFE